MIRTKMTRIKEYDVLKVIAIILVVLSHSTYYNIFSNYGGIAYQQYINNHLSLTVYKIFSKLVEVIYYFHMPLFMAISGVFFSIQVKNNRWYEIESLLTNKFRRLMIPFFVFTLLYTVPIKYLSNYFDGVSLWNAVVGQLFLLGNSHLWYLYALFCIFIAGFYFLKKDTSIFVFLCLYILHVLSFSINLTLVSAPLQFLFWFSLGFLFETKRNQYNHYLKNNKWMSYLVALLFIFCIALNFVFKGDYKLLNRLIMDLIAVLGSLICYNISYYLSNKREIVENRLFNVVLINGLGIYIFSDTLNYFILNVSYSISDRFMFTPLGILTLFLIRFFVTLFGSLVLTLLFKKVFKKYTWLVN